MNDKECIVMKNNAQNLLDEKLTSPQELNKRHIPKKQKIRISSNGNKKSSKSEELATKCFYMVFI